MQVFFFGGVVVRCDAGLAPDSLATSLNENYAYI